MKKPKTLEQITDMLLKGEIDNNEAERLSKGMKLEASPEINEQGNESIIKEDNYLRLVDETGEEKAYIEFKECLDKSGKFFFWLEHVKSHEHGKGYFRKLCNEMENLAKDKNIIYFKAWVHADNIFALSVYKHMGFYPIKSVKGNYETLITMRKDLFNGE